MMRKYEQQEQLIRKLKNRLAEKEKIVSNEHSVLVTHNHFNTSVEDPFEKPSADAFYHPKQ